MKISAYIDQNFSKNVSAAARDMGRRKQTVQQWYDGTIPRKADMQHVFLWSEGAVQPNDFYDLPALPGHHGEAGLKDVGAGSPLRLHHIRTVGNGKSVHGAARSSDGSAVPSQVDMFGGKTNSHAEAHS